MNPSSSEEAFAKLNDWKSRCASLLAIMFNATNGQFTLSKESCVKETSEGIPRIFFTASGGDGWIDLENATFAVGHRLFGAFFKSGSWVVLIEK